MRYSPFVRIRFALAVTLVVCVSACAGGGLLGGASRAPVAALPAPALPDWVASISPTKNGASLSQIRVIFAKPVAAVGALEGDGPRNVLDHIRVDPALPGKFVVLTPRMVGFVAERPLPVSARVRVTLTAGLQDLDGDMLAKDLAWTFETQSLKFTLPDGYDDGSATPSPAPTGLSPTLQMQSNAELDLTTLAAHAKMQGSGDSVALNAKLDKQPDPGDPWTYDLTPQRALHKATTYRAMIGPGVESANGNLPSAATIAIGVRTYDPLRIVTSASPQPAGRFGTGDPVVRFTTPIDPKSLAANMHLIPAPKSTASLFKVSDNDPTVVALDPYALDPQTDYTIEIGAGLADTFGQSLGAAKSVAIHTGNFAPGFWAPSGVSIFPAGAGVALNAYATNLPHGAYRATFVPVGPPASAYTYGDFRGLGDAATWPLQAVDGAKTDAQSVITIPLGQKLGGPTGALAYGFSADLSGDYPATYTGFVQLTDLGLFAQLFPGRATAAVQRLSDGTPIAGASVTLYRLDADNAATRCASGTTGTDGTLDLTGNALAACYAGTRSADEAPSVAMVASSGADWTSATVQSWSGIYNYNVNGGWSNGQPLSRGTIFSDRQMYQPGESARVTGVAYYVRNGTIIADKNASYALKLVDPNNASSSLGSVTTDAFGVFSLVVD